MATRAFGRKEDFDQETDPIVSIQVNNLRLALERYYLVAGKQNPVRIDIPKGTKSWVIHSPLAVAYFSAMTLPQGRPIN